MGKKARERNERREQKRNGKYQVLHVTPSASSDGVAHDWPLSVMRQTDFVQNRVRLDGSQIEAMIQIQCGRWMIDQGVKTMESVLKKRKLYTRFRQASGLMHHAVDKFSDEHLCLEQIMVLHKALDDISIHLCATGEAVPDHCLAMDFNAIKTIADMAGMQCAMECRAGTTQQAKNCKLRRAFNAIPGLQERCLIGKTNLGIDMQDVCPYYLATHLDLVIGGDDTGGEMENSVDAPEV